MSTFASALPRRGTDLLLAHCALLVRPPVDERLRAELGGELARRLVAALSPAQRGVFRRGSSSP